MDHPRTHRSFSLSFSFSNFGRSISAEDIVIMVRMEDPSEYDRLDTIVKEVCKKHGLALDITGWTRKTYDVYLEDRRSRSSEHLARIESFATSSGEIRVFDDRALDFAKELGERLEEAFHLPEAVVVRQDRPL